MDTKPERNHSAHFYDHRGVDFMSYTRCSAAVTAHAMTWKLKISSPKDSACFRITRCTQHEWNLLFWSENFEGLIMLFMTLQTVSGTWMHQWKKPNWLHTWSVVWLSHVRVKIGWQIAGCLIALCWILFYFFGLTQHRWLTGHLEVEGIACSPSGWQLSIGRWVHRLPGRRQSRSGSHWLHALLDRSAKVYK